MAVTPSTPASFLRKFRHAVSQGGKNFFRHSLLTFATMTILAFSLYIMGVTAVVGIVLSSFLDGLEQRLAVNVYFQEDTPEEYILTLKELLEKGGYREIHSVAYVSKEEALQRFLASEGENEDIQKALEIAGGNPLLSHLVIRARQPRDYATIVQALESSAFASFIEDINYTRNKKVIERLEKILSFSRQVGISLGGVFLFIALVITYHSIRTTLYAHRKEFEIMRLVGASNLYIKFPLFVEATIYGILAGVVAYGMLFFSLSSSSSILESLFPGVSFLSFLRMYQWWFLVSMVLAGVFIALLSSAIAIRRYLRV